MEEQRCEKRKERADKKGNGVEPRAKRIKSVSIVKPYHVSVQQDPDDPSSGGLLVVRTSSYGLRLPQSVGEIRQYHLIPMPIRVGEFGQRKPDLAALRQLHADEYASRLQWFLDHTRDVERVPGLWERAALYYERLDRDARHPRVAEALNMFASACALDLPFPFLCVTPDGHEYRTELSQDASPHIAYPHVELTDSRALACDNPAHFIAVMASFAVKPWTGTFARIICHAIGPSYEERARVLVGYLAQESRCRGLRWYGSQGLRIEDLLWDVLRAGLGFEDSDSVYRKFRSLLQSRYHIKTRYECEADM